MKLGHQSRSRYIGDPNFSNIPLEEIISKDLGVKKSKKLTLNVPQAWRASING